MRASTKRSYEKRIEELEKSLAAATKRADQNDNRSRIWERNYHLLREERRQGVESRQWAIEQAMQVNRFDVVMTAKQIADYVYGPDSDADREAENPSLS